MDKCLSCDREFKQFEDFPLVEIMDFKRLQVPDVIMSHYSRELSEKQSTSYFMFWKKLIDNKEIPKEVLSSFRNNGKDIVTYNNLVYKKINFPIDDNLGAKYQVGEDLTSVVKEVINSSPVKDSLSALESYIGKTIRTRDVLNLPGFKSMSAGEYHGISLSIYGKWERIEKRECKVLLVGGWSGGGDFSVYPLRQELAEFNYTGKTNQDV
jgi:hypothetical protein